ncbi:MAG: PAS domain S-box protein, partial [Gammaproteobacteria bacterium]|nr:PAS domain S-box protein [Gammaproteobacteria bacterium]
NGTEVPIEIGLNPIKTAAGVFVLSAIVDLSERKRLEARFRATLESAPTAMLMIDSKGCIALVNLETEKLFGYPRIELLGQAIEILVPERFRTGHPQQRNDFFATPEARRMGEGRDLYGLRKNGSEFPVEIGLSPVEMDDGTYVLSTIVDITERKHLEERFQLLIGGVTEYAIIMLDPHGLVVSWNHGAQRIKGYRADEIIGRSFVCFYTPEEIADGVPQRVLKEAQAKGQVEEEGWRVRKDGSRFWANMLLTALKDKTGNLEGYSKITRDLTDRKRQEQRLRATVESAPTAMIMLDPAGQIILANKEAGLLFSYAPAELLNNPVEILVPMKFRTGHVSLRNGFFAAPNARRMGAGRDLYGIRKDGTEFPVEIGLNPVDTGEGIFVLAAIVDISERKRLESAQRQLNDELDRRVKQRTAELDRSNEALVKSNVELQQFAYIASHDLQAPLRGIIGFSQVLRKRYQDQLDPETEMLFTRIADGVTRMQTLINDLLTYARVESRSRPFEPCKLNEIFDDAVNLLDSSIRDSAAQITRSDLPVVSGDRPQLVQLLQNLIGNAIKYHGELPPRVDIAATRTNGDWDISVHDCGIGIDPKHHERIFEIFRRLHTAQAYPGTGIGLAICRRIVSRHAGKLWVESTAGQGSTFHFTLNAAEKEHS